MISEDDLKSAMVSSEEGEKCLIETLIEYRFTDEKSIAKAISGSYDIEFLPDLDTDHIDFTTSDILSKKYIIEKLDKTFKIEISTILSLEILIPVVSRSKKQIGLDKFNFIKCI